MLVAQYGDDTNKDDRVIDSPEPSRFEGFFELSILRAEDNVRIALLILLLVVALTAPNYVVSRITLFTALIVGVFLTMWTRYAARWGALRAAGQVRTAAGIVLLGEYTWLALFVHGTGGLDSPFSALLLIPVIFASAFFSLLNLAVALSTGLIILTFGIFALSPQSRGQADTGWQLSGMLIAVIAVAWGSYGLCLVLERERRANDLVVRHLSEGVLLIDGLGWIRLCNRQMAQFVGLPAQAILLINIREIPKRPELVQVGEVLRDVLSPESHDPSHVRDITSHTPEPTDLRVITMRLSGGLDRSMGWLVVCQDVTELKSLVRMREDGVRFLSHEIRSPLTTFKMISSIFSELADQLSDASSAKLIEVVDDEVDRMLRLVGQFLDIAAIDQGTYALNIRETDIPELLEKASHSMEVRAEAKEITVSAKCDGQIPPIAADPDALETCLHNLCDNALKHTDRGGQISVTASAEGEEVQIAFADTGRGIPPETQDTIFNEFVQVDTDEGSGPTASRGVGLGLYLVRSLVELHGGRIELESELGRGSTFTIHLPIAGPQPEVA